MIDRKRLIHLFKKNPSKELKISDKKKSKYYMPGPYIEVITNLSPEGRDTIPFDDLDLFLAHTHKKGTVNLFNCYADAYAYTCFFLNRNENRNGVENWNKNYVIFEVEILNPEDSFSRVEFITPEIELNFKLKNGHFKPSSQRALTYVEHDVRNVKILRCITQLYDDKNEKKDLTTLCKIEETLCKIKEDHDKKQNKRGLKWSGK